jgi:hypothetical protein
MLQNCSNKTFEPFLAHFKYFLRVFSFFRLFSRIFKLIKSFSKRVLGYHFFLVERVGGALKTDLRPTMKLSITQIIFVCITGSEIESLLNS